MIGIYCLTNKANGKKYIGQSWQIETRLKQHIINPSNPHMANVFRKYGENAFLQETLITFKDGPFTQGYLDRFESMYIKRYNTLDRKYGYNKRDGGSRGRLSEETKAKISASHKGIKPTEEMRKKSSLSRMGKPTQPCSEAKKEAISRANKGRKRTPEQCARISAAMKGRKTGPCSEARRKAISEAKRGKRPYGFVKDKYGKFVKKDDLVEFRGGAWHAK